QFAHDGMRAQRRRLDLTRRSEHGESNREVEGRAFLAQTGGSEVHDDACPRPLEFGRGYTAADTFLRLLASAVGEPDDRRGGLAVREVRFDLDASWLETNERMCCRASEHTSTVEGEALRVLPLCVKRRSECVRFGDRGRPRCRRRQSAPPV